MHKKIVLPIAVGAVVLTGIIGFLSVRSSASGKIKTDELSDRAQEFVSASRQEDSNEWRLVDFEATPVVSDTAQTQLTTPCFTLQIPFSYTNLQTSLEPKGCVLSVKLLEPLGRLVIGSRPLKGALAEDSGVTLRRREKNSYTETDMKSPAFTAVISFRAKDQVTIFAQKNKTLVTVAFSDVNAEYLESNKIQTLLDSITILP